MTVKIAELKRVVAQIKQGNCAVQMSGSTWSLEPARNHSQNPRYADGKRQVLVQRTASGSKYLHFWFDRGMEVQNDGASNPSG